MTELININTLDSAPYKPLADTARKAGAEGCVLLKNDGRVLPVSKTETISLFGRTQIDYYKSGTGSGGLVRCEYVVNIVDGIRNNPKLTLNEDLAKVYENWIKDNPFDNGAGWAQEPWSQLEMVPDEKTVADARAKSDIAVIIIGRTAGEDRDNNAEKGSWYLTDQEEAMLEVVSRHFEKTAVLLNTGNIIDMNWVQKYNIKSVMYIWQGGQEGGNAAADILCGDVTPSGKLTDTIAKDISLYPSVQNFGSKEFNLYKEDIYVGYRYFETFAKDDVLYPFGYGLSYTEFVSDITSVSSNDLIIEINVRVTNTGSVSGKEVIEAYFEAPQGLMGKSARELCCFKKTKLLCPGESEDICIKIKIDDMCCYDDSGITGNKSCFILEKGDYNIYLGTCVRCAGKVYTHTEAQTRIVKRCREVMAPVREFEIMHPVLKNDSYGISYKKVSLRQADYDKRIKQNLPKDIAITEDKGIKLADVRTGKNSMAEFVSQLSETELLTIVHGEGMCSPKVRPGSAGAVGGVTKSLAKKGIPIAALHDGPSGIRMDNGDTATSLPNGTAIACTWNTCLAQKLYEDLSIELCSHSIDSILGPGVNIHRVPLNGRNFEYLSEDPYLSGKIAASLIAGVQKYGNSATIKHFAVNSQEYCRRDVDSVVSERALREIYLKCFEIAIKEGKPTSLMTSYNPINGIWAANNYDLCTIILRDEWGYDGFVMTDWWPKLEKGDEITPDIMPLTRMVEAQNDVFMPTPDALRFKDDLRESLQISRLTIGQLQRNAANILKYLMNSHALERFEASGGFMQDSLIESLDSLTSAVILTNVEPDITYALKTQRPGRQLLSIEYTSSEASVSQMTVDIVIDGKAAASVTVNGTDGETKTVYADVDVISCDINLCIRYPKKLMQIKKIEIMQ